jgi:hypothetical protein
LCHLQQNLMIKEIMKFLTLSGLVFKIKLIAMKFNVDCGVNISLYFV